MIVHKVSLVAPMAFALCQGDPLSPLLFVIVMEALNRMLSRAMVGVIYQNSREIQNATPWKYPTLFLQMLRLLRVMQITTKSI